jgi:hypothetical protein
LAESKQQCLCAFIRTAAGRGVFLGIAIGDWAAYWEREGCKTMKMNKMKIFSQAQTSGLSNYANVQIGIRQLGAMSEGNRATAAANLLTLNAALTGNASYQVNEKLVNQILLQTVAVDNLLLSEAQIFVLENIAAGCPLSDGEAVLRARTMLQLIQGSPVNYDDSSVCGGGERSEKSGNATQLVRVYPNPASNSVTVEYLPGEVIANQLLLYNSFGQTVMMITLPNNQTSIQFSLINLPEGVYWYTIPGLPNSSGKLVINH